MQEKKAQNQGLDKIDFYVSPKQKNKHGHSRIHPSNTRDANGSIDAMNEMMEFDSRNPFYQNAAVNSRLTQVALGA